MLSSLGKALVCAAIAASVPLCPAGDDEDAIQAMARVGAGEPVAELTSAEVTQAEAALRADPDLRERVIQLVEMGDIDAAILDHPVLGPTLALPDPEDDFRMLTAESASPLSQYHVRLALRVDGVAMIGFEVPCQLWFSRREGLSEPVREITLAATYDPRRIEVTDSIDGNEAFDVFRLMPDMEAAGVQITRQEIRPASGELEVDLALPDDFGEVHDILGYFMCKGLRQTTGSPIQFMRATPASGEARQAQGPATAVRGATRALLTSSESSSEVLLEDGRFVCVF